jgi:hypothetical protein
VHQVLCRQIEKKKGSARPCVWRKEGEKKKVRLLFAILFAWRRFLGAIRKTNGFAASPKNGKRYTTTSKKNM